MKEYQIVYLEAVKNYKIVPGKNPCSIQGEQGLGLEGVVDYFRTQPDIKKRASLITLSGPVPEKEKVRLRKVLSSLSSRIVLVS